jgi:hypothetical protein
LVENPPLRKWKARGTRDRIEHLRGKDEPANAFSLPVSTMAPISASSSYFFRASFNSTNRALERALSAFGRLSVTVDCGSEMVSFEKEGQMKEWKLCYILNPTPGLGVETNMFS